MKKILAILAAVLLAGTMAAPAARAYEVTYDFTAQGNVYTYTGNGDELTEGPLETISGSITFNVLTVAPPAGAILDPDGRYALVYDGSWVISEFEGNCSAGSLAPVPRSPSDRLDQFVQVFNVYSTPTQPLYTSQNAGKTYEVYDDSTSTLYTSSANLNRFAYGPESWFSGLSWVDGLSPQYNYLYAGNTSVDYTTAPLTYHGYGGLFVIDSWVLSPASMLRRLASAVAGVGPGKSLIDKIALARTYYAVPDVQATCAVLTGFVNEVRAQRGKMITPDLADKLSADAQAIMQAIGCD